MVDTFSPFCLSVLTERSRFVGYSKRADSGAKRAGSGTRTNRVRSRSSQARVYQQCLLIRACARGTCGLDRANSPHGPNVTESDIRVTPAHHAIGRKTPIARHTSQTDSPVCLRRSRSLRHLPNLTRNKQRQHNKRDQQNVARHDSSSNSSTLIQHPRSCVLSSSQTIAAA